jgi:hypothetical protein
MTNLSTEPTYFTFQMVRLTILPIVEAALFAQAGIVKLIMEQCILKPINNCWNIKISLTYQILIGIKCCSIFLH